ncbi:MAG: hypothetical protein ACYCSJ_11890 [Acidimicrobiales bacterium]
MRHLLPLSAHGRDGSVRTAARVAAAGLVLTGCGLNAGRGFQVGVKQVGVNLAFANGSLLTTRVVHLLPEPVAGYGAFLAQISNLDNVQTVNGAQPPGLSPLRPHPTCPTAGPGARPDQPIKVLVTEPPAPGLYTEHNTGRFTLVEDGLSLSGQYPAQGEYTIQNEKTDSSTDSTPVQGEAGPNGTVTDFYYDLVEVGVDGSETTTTYRDHIVQGSAVNKAQLEAGTGPGTTGELDLVKQVVQNSQGTSTFQPSSPVEMVAFNKGVGDSWNSVGVDTNTGTIMTVQGSIKAIDNVDVCGRVVEAYRVVSNEKISNTQSGFTSATNTSDPNVYEIAPQFGGIMVRQHIDTTTTYTSGGSATVVDLNYTSTLNSVHPE